LKKLPEEEKKWLKKIAQKSDLLKNPNPQRGGNSSYYLTKSFDYSKLITIW